MKFVATVIAALSLVSAIQATITIDGFEQLLTIPQAIDVLEQVLKVGYSDQLQDEERMKKLLDTSFPLCVSDDTDKKEQQNTAEARKLLEEYLSVKFKGSDDCGAMFAELVTVEILKKYLGHTEQHQYKNFIEDMAKALKGIVDYDHTAYLDQQWEGSLINMSLRILNGNDKDNISLVNHTLCLYKEELTLGDVKNPEWLRTRLEFFRKVIEGASFSASATQAETWIDNRMDKLNQVVIKFNYCEDIPTSILMLNRYLEKVEDDIAKGEDATWPWMTYSSLLGYFIRDLNCEKEEAQNSLENAINTPSISVVSSSNSLSRASVRTPSLGFGFLG